MSEVAHLNDVLHRKNLELDALHFVWCDGGCPSGVHRFDHGELTEEIVVEAERNTKRLRAWWLNAEFKARWAVMSQRERDEWYVNKADTASSERSGSEQ